MCPGLKHISFEGWHSSFKIKGIAGGDPGDALILKWQTQNPSAIARLAPCQWRDFSGVNDSVACGWERCISSTAKHVFEKIQCQRWKAKCALHPEINTNTNIRKIQISQLKDRQCTGAASRALPCCIFWLLVRALRNRRCTWPFFHIFFFWLGCHCNSH